MKYKKIVSDQLDNLRASIQNTKYNVTSGGNWQDILSSFDKCFETLDKARELVDLEPDNFKNDQIV